MISLRIQNAMLDAGDPVPLCVLGRCQAGFFFENATEVIKTGKTALFRRLRHRCRGLGQQLLGFLQAKLQNILLRCGLVPLGKQSAKINLADSGFRCQLGIGKRRVMQIGFHVLNDRKQWIGFRPAGIGQLIQKTVEDTEGLRTAAAEQKDRAKRLAIPQTALRIGQGDGQNLRAIQTFTGEV